MEMSREFLTEWSVKQPSNRDFLLSSSMGLSVPVLGFFLSIFWVESIHINVLFHIPMDVSLGMCYFIVASAAFGILPWNMSCPE